MSDADKMFQIYTMNKKYMVVRVSPERDYLLEAASERECGEMVDLCNTEIARLQAENKRLFGVVDELTGQERPSDAIREIGKMVDERNSLRKALTPSAETKGAYSGEFLFDTVEYDDEGNEYNFARVVPWTTIKEIMTVIREAAEAANK